MSRIVLDRLCIQKCRKKQCADCGKCTNKSCIRDNCNCNNTLQTNIAIGNRSTKWSGRIIPGVDVPTVQPGALTLDFRKLERSTIQKINTTIPNMIDNSDAADLSEVNRLLVLNSDDIPGKNRRWHSNIDQFSSEEISRMSNYCHRAYDSLCKLVLPNDALSLQNYTTKADQTEWTEISRRWTNTAKELPFCAERSAILALICQEQNRKKLPPITKEAFALHRRNATILRNGKELPIRATLYTRYIPEQILKAVQFILSPANVITVSWKNLELIWMNGGEPIKLII